MKRVDHRRSSTRPEPEFDVGRALSELHALSDQLLVHGVVLESGAPARLARYLEMLVQSNQRHNLVSRHDIPELVAKHVAPSLGVLASVGSTQGGDWVDVGTGGGFPGMVLKLANPSISMTLVESSTKKCLFLERVARDVGAEVSIVQKRVETFLGQDGANGGRFAVATSRAVMPLSDALRAFGSIVQGGGRFLTFKGPGWVAEVERAIRDQDLRTRYRVRRVYVVPWAQGRIVEVLSLH